QKKDKKDRFPNGLV
uniref:Tachykinin-like peptide-XV n=1 Tax=Phoneutria nigriventer TaxID=6918 RepID=TLP15_PHONI|nr:RecName: Full=Tachykinin-like peptide-XV; AltName: Full=P.nigriventer tachykinin peptides XV; Short=PnTkP-XV; AltName: Full=U29-ctenitoxin-Pn1o; Short=U29-CNTX-Pn1o [Phoneutria nigriventer]